jgi:hypothetical protein
MKAIQQKMLIAFAPFLFFVGNMLLIGALSTIESSPLDSDWKTRQLIIGLYIFTGISFLPRLLHLSTCSTFPFLKINLSHHTLQRHNSHELSFYNASVCTGCLGTAISIILGSIILLLYFYKLQIIESIRIPDLFLIGVICIIFTFSRYFIELTPLIRLIQHSTLFLALAFFIIMNDLLFSSAFLMTLLLPSWLFFLIARIQLSKIEHTPIV